MLVIRAFINAKHVGQIHVQRIEKRNSRRKIYTYEIVIPRGFKEHTIKHRYDDGWMVLTEKVLRIIRRHQT